MNSTYAKHNASTATERRQVYSRAGWQTQQTQSRPTHVRQAPSLTQIGLFSSSEIPEGTLLTLCPGCKHVPAKQVIFYKGDPAMQLFVVLAGKVKVSVPSEDGKEITFAILGPGELLGEMGMIEGAEHSATVTALEPSELAVFDRREFVPLITSYPAVAFKLLGILCARLRQASQVAEDISFLTLPARLAKRLSALVDAYGEPTPKGIKIGLQLCQQELANLVGTSRESINKQLAVWQAEGLVMMEKGYLIIRRPHELSDMISQQEGRACSRKAIG